LHSNDQNTPQILLHEPTTCIIYAIQPKNLKVKSPKKKKKKKEKKKTKTKKTKKKKKKKTKKKKKKKKAAPLMACMYNTIRLLAVIHLWPSA